MKTNGMTIPAAVSVVPLPDGMAEIVLCTGVQPVEDTVEYERFLLHRPWRAGLEADIAVNFGAWLTLARAEEAATATAETAIHGPAETDTRMAKLEQNGEVMAAAVEELILMVMGGDS